MEALDQALSPCIRLSGASLSNSLCRSRRSRVLDHLLIYTALVRGIKMVMLIGDLDLLCIAAEANFFKLSGVAEPERGQL